MLSIERQPAIHIFTSMFYKRLIDTPKKVTEVNSFECDMSLSKAQIRYMRVHKWTKKINLFDKTMVLIPICEHDHWYLVIAINLTNIMRGNQKNIKDGKGTPFIMVLDSWGNTEPEAVTTIRQFFAQEWEAKVKCCVICFGQITINLKAIMSSV